MRQRPKHKFHAKPTDVDGIKFPSKLEATHYGRLKLMREHGAVLFFLRQVPIHLPAGVKLVVDFVVFWTDGTVTFEDTKGFETPEFKTKRRMVEELYPIELVLVTK